MTVWLSLGSNLSNPAHQLERAISFITEKCYLTLLRQSRMMSTKPVGFIDQPDFVNQVIEVSTSLSPRELLRFLKQAETELGRESGFHWGPRLIDLDILLYNDKIINEEGLNIPHPEILNRSFILELLQELIPDYIHPEKGKTLKQIYQEFANQGGT